MMPVPYHGCTCHLRYAAAAAKENQVNQANGRSHGRGGKYDEIRASQQHHSGGSSANNNNNGGGLSKWFGSSKRDDADGAKRDDQGDENNDDEFKVDEIRPQPWYFHIVASLILVVHGFTFLVPQEVSEAEDTDMVRTIGKWLGFDWECIKPCTPYAQGLASVFNISLGIVSWWTSKESERYNRLIQLRVFAFCINILHAYITGPIIYQNDDVPLLAPGRIIGLFRLSYLTPGLMAAGVTEVIVEKEQEQTRRAKKKEAEATAKPDKKDSKTTK